VQCDITRDIYHTFESAHSYIYVKVQWLDSFKKQKLKLIHLSIQKKKQIWLASHCFKVITLHHSKVPSTLTARLNIQRKTIQGQIYTPRYSQSIKDIVKNIFFFPNQTKIGLNSVGAVIYIKRKEFNKIILTWKIVYSANIKYADCGSFINSSAESGLCIPINDLKNL
jgi:hypothetical protein